MSEEVVLVGYSVGVLCASLAGGLAPMLLRFTHRQLQFAVSLVAGLILGISVFDLLPHAIENLKSPHELANYLLAGLLVMFLLERFFCFHHHDAEPLAGDHDHAGCGHAHGHHDHSLTWGGVMVGLSVHSLLNGVALAASVRTGHSAAAALPGLGVFLAVALHKPFDALTVGTLMAARGEPLRKQLIVNGLFSLAVPLGVSLFYFGTNVVIGDTHLTGAVLAFSAGIFLCIALSDLLPELQFHSHDRVKLSIALAIRLGLAWFFGRMESSLPAHDHTRAPVIGEEHA